MKINIYDHMILNLQSISVKVRPAFAVFFKSAWGIEDLQLHAGNVYLFELPAEGEFTRLNSQQRKFIFEKELSLYEVQYEIDFPFEDALFEQFFEITWHGVVYHGGIKSL